MMIMKEGALITVYGKPMLGVLRKGDLGQLGKELLSSDKTPQSVIEAARRHGIYYLNPDVFSEEEWCRLAVLAQKWRNMETMFNAEKYLGWGRHHYDLQGDKVYYRDLGGEGKVRGKPLPRMKRVQNPEVVERRW